MTAKKEGKIIIYTIAILLFIFNYTICDYFFYNNVIKDISKWWGLKSQIYALIISLVFFASRIGTKGKLRLLLDVCLGLCLSNFIDKAFFNVISFNYNDIIMIIVTVCISYYDYLKNKI